MRASEKAYWERFEVELRKMRAQVVSLKRRSSAGRLVALEGFLAVAPGCRRAGAAVAAGVVDGTWHEMPAYRGEGARGRRCADGPGHRGVARYDHRD